MAIVQNLNLYARGSKCFDTVIRMTPGVLLAHEDETRVNHG